MVVRGGWERERDGSVALVNDRKGVAVDHMDAPPGLQEEEGALYPISLSHFPFPAIDFANVPSKNPNSDHFF